MHLATPVNKEKHNKNDVTFVVELRFCLLCDLIRNAGSTFIWGKTKTSMPKLTLDTAMMKKKIRLWFILSPPKSTLIPALVCQHYTYIRSCGTIWNLQSTVLQGSRTRFTGFCI